MAHMKKDLTGIGHDGANWSNLDLGDDDSDHLLSSGLSGYMAPVELPFELPTRIYGCMLAIWQLRPYLQRKFPLHQGHAIDYLRFLAWCVSAGRRDYAILRELGEWNTELQRPIALPVLNKDRWQGSFNVAMYLMGITRSRYWAAPIQISARLRHSVARWYWRNGRHELDLTDTPPWQLDALTRCFATPQQFTRNILIFKDRKSPKALCAVRRRNNDLYRQWPQSPSTTVPEAAVVVPTSPVGVRLMAKTTPNYLRQLSALRTEMTRNPTDAQVESVTRRIDTARQAEFSIPASTPFGVNLYGYARGELGIGEDVRMLAQALSTTEVPFCIINVEPGSGVSQSDLSAEQWLSEQPRYSINIFCMTGIEQTRVLCEKGMAWFQGRYNIGLWPWELPKWPSAWQHAWNGVQELWGISQYTADAYRGAPVPVAPINLPVCVGEVGRLTRKDFGLPPSSYLFVFSFDLNSSMARKNPQAVVDAFQSAFPKRSPDDVGLVIKVNHPNDQDKAWKALKRKIKADKRIHVIDQSLRKQDVMALYRCCDCYISLHRAEGFGRGIAEAQVLNLDVIVTGFSGNLCFCDPATTHWVNYRRRTIAAGEYSYSTGQYWAQPDIGHAAELMQKVRQDGRGGDSGDNKHRTEQFSPAYCGAKYQQKLERIHARITGKGASEC